MMRSTMVTAAVGSVILLGASHVTIGASPGAGGVGDPYYPLDGNGGYLVDHYDVKLDYDPARPDFLTGHAEIRAVTTQDLARFDLDLTGFEVTAVTVNGLSAKDVTRSGQHELVITPAQSVPHGRRLDVAISYRGTPGFFWMTANDEGAVHAFGEPQSASSWYPVNDHPSDKASFHLTATVPDGWTVVSIGEPEPIAKHDGRTTFRWNERQPVASYLTGVVIDKMTVRTTTLAGGIPVVDAYLPGGDAAKPQEDRLPEILKFLTATFGPYPFSSAGGIFYPGDSGGGFELQGRPVYPTGVPADRLTDIVHENAHQWFGNSVSVKDWRDICIKECFATYAEWLWREAKEGHDLDADYRHVVAAEKHDPTFWKQPLYDPGPYSYGGAYDTGPLMLHALRRTVGDHVFFQTLRDWLRSHQYGNASWPEFEQLAQQESGKQLDGFFQAWAHSTVIPADQYLYPGALKP